MGVIIKACKKCKGSKWKMVNAKPIEFKPCNKCQGRGGRMMKDQGK